MKKLIWGLAVALSLLGLAAWRFPAPAPPAEWQPMLSARGRWMHVSRVLEAQQAKSLPAYPYDLKKGGRLLLFGVSVIAQEPHVVNILTQLDCAGAPLVVDVGANDGFVSLAAAVYGCETWGFELQDTCLELARATQRLNGVERPTRFLQRAVSNVSGNRISLAMSPLCHGGFSVRNRGSEREFETVALDDLFDRRIALLKIDIEGTEFEVVEGARNLLKRGLIDAIVMEATWWPASKQDAFGRLAFVYDHGYNIRCLAGYQEPKLAGVLYANKQQWLAAQLKGCLANGQEYIRCTEMLVCKRRGCRFMH